MENFTPVSGLIGGMIIGLAATLFMYINGRVAGISGILGNLIGAGREGSFWRLAFLFGLVLGPLLVSLIRHDPNVVDLQASPLTLALAGVLVGFGTRLGGGCTSGHSVCGIPRGSMRSILATVIFFASALITVFITRHVMGG